MVSGDSSIGGLVGYNQSSASISNYYSTGAVSGSSSCGGLIGYKISGSVVGSFWNTQTSGQPNRDGGTGKTTAEMKTLSTFTVVPANWDFIGETDNGTNDYWRMCADGVDYPRLSWEFVKGGDFSCPDGVAMDDVVRLSQDWLATYSQAFYGADANGDSGVTFADFAILAANWLE